MTIKQKSNILSIYFILTILIGISLDLIISNYGIVIYMIFSFILIIYLQFIYINFCDKIKIIDSDLFKKYINHYLFKNGTKLMFNISIYNSRKVDEKIPNELQEQYKYIKKTIRLTTFSIIIIFIMFIIAAIQTNYYPKSL